MKFLILCTELYSRNKITQASAALAYYLTMSFFPLLVLVYIFLGESLERTTQLIVFAEQIVPRDMLSFLGDYLLHIDSGDRGLMLPLGLSLLAAYAAAGIRSVQGTIGSIQGGAEHSGFISFVMSFIYCFVLLALTCLAGLLMLAWPMLVNIFSRFMPELNRVFDLMPIGSVALGLMLFLFLLGIYHVPKRRQDKYSVLPGAILASLTVMISSPLFSLVMSRSVKYSLVYGAIASLILFMLWLYFCSVLIYCGVIVNVALYQVRNISD